MALEVEAKSFEARRAELLKDHAGQFAVVKGETLFGTFTTFTEAFEAGVRQYGVTPFMVREITSEDLPILLPALNAGLISAR